MFTEDDLLPLSALQHFLFCPRRAALVLVEGIWDENRATAEGALAHERVHEAEPESRGDVRIARGLRIRSLRLGLTGQTDVVEFHKLPDHGPPSDKEAGLSTGIELDGIEGFWRPYPIEYKSGRLRHERGYEVQLCAQALCLEEMLNVRINEGALFYGKTKRRLEISFDEKLRTETEVAAQDLHRLVDSRSTPKAKYQKKCRECSLLAVCMPKVTGVQRNVAAYLQKALNPTDWEHQ
ncbi:MAG: CRISPR-associated protein Cas4 [Desulfomonile tiedjei]|nr:CRISPR-associated protein Cas4 [Desulfomonile tiedjei]